MTPALNRKIIGQLYFYRTKRGATRMARWVDSLISERPVLLDNGLLLSGKYSDPTFQIACCERNERFGRFCEAIKEKDIFLDIGANIGLMSLIASYRAKYVFSIEPSFEVVRRLYNNIRINKRHNIFPIQAAASRRVEGVYLSMGRNSGIASISDQSSGLPVTAIHLDPFLLSLRESQPKECMIYLKIDVEGLELSVLRGLKNSIQNRLIDGIFIELGRGRSVGDFAHADGHDEIYRILGDAGYTYDFPVDASGVYDQTFRWKA